MSQYDALRRAWETEILPEDIDSHMARIGQAEANASLVFEFIRQEKAGASLLFMGAGTGQMFDYVSPLELLPYKVTFSDLSQTYLDRLRDRLVGVEGLNYETVVDDIEASGLDSKFDLVIAVLVLEHVDWRRAIANLANPYYKRILVIHQENSTHLEAAITPSRPLVGSMAVLAAARPHLLSRNEIVKEFYENAFELADSSFRYVMDEKRMVALAFEYMG